MKVNMKSQWFVLSVLTMLSVLAWQTGWGQEPAERPVPGDSPYDTRIGGPEMGMPRGMMPGFAVRGSYEMAAAIGKTVESLRNADDDETKAKAEKQLRELLRNYFGEDMARREKELEAMENRLTKLKEQLARRRDKMNEILDLQVKVLVNEADGLGFFSIGPSSESQPTRNSYWYDGSPPSNAVAQPPAAPVVSRIIAAPAGPPTDPTRPTKTFEAPLERVEPAPTRSR
jgi:hypothetical protein